jgi:hypothetical protein
MKYLYCLLVFILPNLSHAQKVLKGMIIEEETGNPVSAASVYLNNTSIGTTSNAQGQFELSLPAGKFDLIVSSIGFDTYSQAINATTIDSSLTIKLLPKVKALETVVLEPYLKDGWEKWGKFFLENFIGTSAYATECRIKNPKVIRFRHSKNTNKLTAHVMEPLVIENKALGYSIHYQLENFTYDFKNRYVFYEGYPFFAPMKGNSVKQKRWGKNRKKVYEGSMLHFMRSLYQNKINDEGFTINYLKKIPNAEKQRVKDLHAKATKTVQSGNATIAVNSMTANADSVEYYDSVIEQADYFDVINKTQLTGDSIAYGIDSTTAGLYFSDYLLVVYKKGIVPAKYQELFPRAGAEMISQLTLLRNEPVAIEATGAYYQPSNVLSLGYWAWFEKIATLLPFDYEPTRVE